jgi:hypothetical protein
VLGTTHIVIQAIVIVGLSVIVSLLVLMLVRWAIPHERLTPHNEVSGFVYAVIGVVYAVILGFAVITVWEHFTDAKANARAEADAVGDVYRIAGGLPEPSRQDIQATLRDYASVVVDQEWAAMNDGEAPVEQASADLDALWSAFYAVEVSTATEEALYAEGLDQMDELSSHRRERLEDNEAALLGVMWGVIFAGAALTVLFPCLFGVENGLVHSLIIGTLAAAIGLLLVLTYDINYPFRGDVTVAPEGFTRVLEQMRPAEQSTRVGVPR